MYVKSISLVYQVKKTTNMWLISVALWGILNQFFQCVADFENMHFTKQNRINEENNKNSRYYCFYLEGKWKHVKTSCSNSSNYCFWHQRKRLWQPSVRMKAILFFLYLYHSIIKFTFLIITQQLFFLGDKKFWKAFLRSI